VPARAGLAPLASTTTSLLCVASVLVERFVLGLVRAVSGLDA
jgi:hypothetical protein